MNKLVAIQVQSNDFAKAQWHIQGGGGVLRVLKHLPKAKECN